MGSKREVCGFAELIMEVWKKSVDESTLSETEVLQTSHKLLDTYCSCQLQGVAVLKRNLDLFFATIIDQ